MGREPAHHLSIGAAARLLEVSWWWVWRRVRTGEIKAVRLTDTSQYRIPRAALDPLLHRLHNLHSNHD